MSTLDDLNTLVQTLRSPSGCPWDQKQTLDDMPKQLLEECYEVIEAIQSKDAIGVQEELGDLLFVVLLACNTAQKDMDIALDSIYSSIHEKMIRRHPHIFAKDSNSVLSWEELKQKEKQRTSILDGIPSILPALHYAQKQASRVAKVGFDWPNLSGVISKIEEEFIELQEAINKKSPADIEHELGDILMACANLGRKLQISAEFALKKATKRFSTRFRWMEQNSAVALSNLSAQELEFLWVQAKQKENM